MATTENLIEQQQIEIKKKTIKQLRIIVFSGRDTLKLFSSIR